jgi:hypothetical protein
MAKVLTKNIKEPDDHSFWILDDKYVRIYKILVKEENMNYKLFTEIK